MKIVHHIAFNCLSIQKQEAFYSEHFGFRRVRVFNQGEDNEFITLRLGNTCMELFSAASHTRAPGGEQCVGFKHLAFEVCDLDGVIAKLQADDIQTEPVKDCSPSDPGLRFCFFSDPEGNSVELMQGWKDELTH